MADHRFNGHNTPWCPIEHVPVSIDDDGTCSACGFVVFPSVEVGEIPGGLTRSVVAALEPEVWQGHTTPAGMSGTGSSGSCVLWNYDWDEIVRYYLRQDMGSMCALAMSMVANGGNQEPIVMCKYVYGPYSARRGIWNGNHRAAVAYAFDLPLRFVLVDSSALLEACDRLSDGGL